MIPKNRFYPSNAHMSRDELVDIMFNKLFLVDDAKDQKFFRLLEDPGRRKNIKDYLHNKMPNKFGQDYVDERYRAMTLGWTVDTHLDEWLHEWVNNPKHGLRKHVTNFIEDTYPHLLSYAVKPLRVIGEKTQATVS